MHCVCVSRSVSLGEGEGKRESERESDIRGDSVGTILFTQLVSVL